MDFYQIWYRGSPRGRNQLCRIFYRSVQVYWFSGGLKFAYPHRNWRSPLTLFELPFRLWYLKRSFLLLVTSASELLVHTIRFCSVVFGVTSSLAVIHSASDSFTIMALYKFIYLLTHNLSWLCIVRERTWLLSRWRTTETVTLSRVALGGRIPAVYDQRYKCHNLRDGGRRPPATTMFTTPRLLQRKQQAYRLRIAISAYPTCIRRPRRRMSVRLFNTRQYSIETVTHNFFHRPIATPFNFLPCDAMRKRGICRHPVSVRLSVGHVRELRQNE